MTEADTTDGNADRPRDVDTGGSRSEAGRAVRKVDGRGIVTGQVKYTDDVPTEDALEVEILRSPHAHAEVVEVDTDRAEAVDGVHAVLTHADVSDDRFCRAETPPLSPGGDPYDERILDEKVRFVGDPVAVVAAETAAIAQRAAEHLEVTYDTLEAVTEPSEATEDGAPIIHDEVDYASGHDSANRRRNIVVQKEVEEGDVEEGWAQADEIVENSYRTQTVQQAPMEMNTTVSWLDGCGRLVVRTSTQIPHMTREILAKIFDLPRNDVRVVVPQVGGGFGAKADVVPSQIFAGLVTLETGRKVRVENSRTEDLNTASRRHDMEIDVKAGVEENGRITAIRLDVTSNSGAYGGHALGTLTGAGAKALNLYPCENRKFTGRAVYTNLPPAGAMRAYGNPQGTFALESHVDEMAAAVDMDPVEFRRKNMVTEGEAAFGSDRPLESVGLDECIDRACTAIDWDGGPRDPDEPHLSRGYGIALVNQGSGASVDEYAEAEVILERDGSITLLTGAGGMGQGTATTQSQIAAEALGVDTDDVSARTGDTDVTPWDNGAYADSTTYVSGRATLEAAEDLAEQIRERASRYLAADPDELALQDGSVVAPGGDRLALGEFADRLFDSDDPKRRLKGRGEHVPSVSPPSFAAQIVEVEVNERTGQFEVRTSINAVDCGFAINPDNARGQVIGATIMGLGQAISEELAFDADGNPQIHGLKDYGVLRSDDIPETVDCILVESGEPTGPFGAKSVGQVATSGPLPAVANAIDDAVGVRIDELPVTAERLRAELDGSE